MITLTNCDRESYKGSDSRLGRPWDAIYTAENIGSYKPYGRGYWAYKPSRRNFEYLLERVDNDFGFRKKDILHVAQSLFHDHEPATALGLATAWIDLSQDLEGHGATKTPSGPYRTDFQFKSMAGFVRAHKDELRKATPA